MSKNIIAVNGSPRVNGNTAKILKSALDGAASVGANVEMVHLGKLSFGGCRSCFACKLKGGKSYGQCAIKDDLSPVLERIQDCDGLLLGSPIYFGGESGTFRCFAERLFFSLLRYDMERGSLAKKQFPVAFFYTMNVKPEHMKQMNYTQNMGALAMGARRIFGAETVEQHFVCDTLQFDDYSKYDAPMFDPVHKKTVHDTQFPEDCRKAFEVGKRLGS